MKIIFLILAVVLVGVGIGAFIFLSQQAPSRQQIKTKLQSLESYAAECVFLTEQLKNKQVSKTFANAHISELQKQIENVDTTFMQKQKDSLQHTSTQGHRLSEMLTMQYSALVNSSKYSAVLDSCRKIFFTTGSLEKSL